MKLFGKRIKLPGRKTWAVLIGLLLALVGAAWFTIRPVMPDFREFPATAVTRPPEGLGLPAFYAKYFNPSGIAVMSSGKVPDEALLAASAVIDGMLATRPELRTALADGSARIAIVGAGERTTEIPEYWWKFPHAYWDQRARGFGGHWFLPVTLCAEEDVLGYQTNRWSGESIIVHEFAHAVHEIGMHRLDPAFDGRLKQLYQSAMKQGRWKDTYAATSRNEYWAESVQSYFDSNEKADPPNGIHNAVRTREALAEYDPELFALIDEIFAKNPWRWTPNGDHARAWR